MDSDDFQLEVNSDDFKIFTNNSNNYDNNNNSCNINNNSYNIGDKNNENLIDSPILSTQSAQSNNHEIIKIISSNEELQKNGNIYSINNNSNKDSPLNYSPSLLLSFTSFSNVFGLNNNSNNGCNNNENNNIGIINNKDNKIKQIEIINNKNGNNYYDSSIYLSSNLNDLSNLVSNSPIIQNQNSKIATSGAIDYFIPKHRFYSIASFELYKSIVLHNPSISTLLVKPSASSYIQVSLLCILNSIHNQKKVLWISPESNTQLLESLVEYINGQGFKSQLIENTFTNSESLKQLISNSNSNFYYIKENKNFNNSTQEINFNFLFDFDLIFYDIFKLEFKFSNFMKQIIQQYNSNNSKSRLNSILILSNDHPLDYSEIYNHFRIEYIHSCIDSDCIVNIKEKIVYDVPSNIEKFIQNILVFSNSLSLNTNEKELLNSLVLNLINNGISFLSDYIRLKSSNFENSKWFNRVFNQVINLNNEIDAGIGEDINKFEQLKEFLNNQLKLISSLNFTTTTSSIIESSNCHSNNNINQIKCPIFKVLIVTSGNSIIDSIYRRLLKVNKIRPFKSLDYLCSTSPFENYNCLIVSIENINYSIIHPSDFSIIVEYDHYQLNEDYSLLFSTFLNNNASSTKLVKLLPSLYNNNNCLVNKFLDFTSNTKFNKKIQILRNLLNSTRFTSLSSSSLSTTPPNKDSSSKLLINLKKLFQLQKLNDNLFLSINSDDSDQNIISNSNDNSYNNLSIEILLICNENFLQHRQLMHILIKECNVRFIERSLNSNIDLILDERNCMLIISLEEFKNRGSKDQILEIILKDIIIASYQFEKCWVLVECDNQNSTCFISTIFNNLVHNLIINCNKLFKENEIQFLFSFSPIQSSYFIRATCETIAENSLIWNNSLKIWSDRKYLLDIESAHERFLSLIPGFNPFTSQLLLTWKPLEFILFSNQDQLKQAFPWVPNKTWILFNKFLNSNHNNNHNNNSNNDIINNDNYKNNGNNINNNINPHKPTPPSKSLLKVSLPKKPPAPNNISSFKNSKRPSPIISPPNPFSNINNNTNNHNYNCTPKKPAINNFKKYYNNYQTITITNNKNNNISKSTTTNNVLNNINLMKPISTVKKSFSTILSKQNTSFKQTLIDHYLQKNNNNK